MTNPTADNVQNLRGKDRLIVALDVPGHEEAMRLVDSLDNVSFFKIGLELFMAGDILGLIQRLHQKRSQKAGVFVDLKLGGDIRNTVTRFVRACMNANVTFLTLVETVPLAITLDTLRTAKEARGAAESPRLLMVPYLSSLDGEDLRRSGLADDLDAFIIDRARAMLGSGGEGLIVSGEAIKLCRDTFGPGVVIVSPGIRPAWAASTGGHKRFTTPAQAIQFGSTYLVVGRPITDAPSPREAAQRVIEEIDAALDEPPRTSSSAAGSDRWAMSARLRS